MRKYLLTLSILIISAKIHSQNINRCYRQINAGEYASASQKLYKIIDKKFNPLAYYFFAQLLSKENNPEMDLALAYSSLRFIYPDSSNYFLSKTKKKKYVYQYGFRYSNLKILHNELCGRALDSTRHKNTVKDYGYYLATYTTSPFLKIAMQERNALAWEWARSLNTAVSINEFIKTYPEAIQIPEAKKLFDQLNYLESTVGKTASDYQQFLNNNPESPFYKEAKEKYEQLFYEEETKDQSMVSYYRFIIDHSDSPYYLDAWNKLKTADSDFLLSVLPDLTTYYNGKDIENDLWKTLLHLKVTRIDSITINWFHACYSHHPFHNYFDSLLQSLSIKLFPVEHNGFYGFTNEKGDTIIYPVYDDVTEFSEGYAAVALGLEDQDVYGFINPFGQTVISFSYDDAYSFKNGLALVGAKDSSGDMQYGFINPFEVFIIPMNFQDADTFSEGVTLLQNKAGKYGFLNEQGETVLPFAFTDANDFSEGVAPVELDTFWSFIHHDGTMAIKKVFNGAFSFSDSLAAVKDEYGKWGYINHTGDWIIPAQFLSATSFNNGTATVLVLSKPTKKNKIPLQIEKVIDKTGKELK